MSLVRSSSLSLLCATAILGCAPRPLPPSDGPLSAEPLLPSLAAMAASASASASVAALPPVPLRFTWVVPPQYADRSGGAFVKLVAPSGETTFTCTYVFEPARRKPDSSLCAAATGWLRGPGTYTLDIHVRPAWKSNVPDLRHTFRVDGSEIGFDTLLEMDAKQESPNDPFVRRFQVDRVVPPPREVVLERAKTPGPNAHLAYVIRNGSTDPLLGFGSRNLIAGHVDVFEDGRWQAYNFGWKGADQSMGDAIPPGGAAVVGESVVAPGVAPFGPGRYRYVVHVMRGPQRTLDPDAGAPAVITEAEAREVYELRDEVEIR